MIELSSKTKDRLKAEFDHDNKKWSGKLLDRECVLAIEQNKHPHRGYVFVKYRIDEQLDVYERIPLIYSNNKQALISAANDYWKTQPVNKEKSTNFYKLLVVL